MSKSRRGLPKELRVYINTFLDTYPTIENIRDIWYNIKGNIEYLNDKDSDADWDKYVNTIIGEHLYEDMFLEGDTSIYDRLGIISKGLEGVGHEFNTPIVLFVEKTTRAIDNATEALLCGRYDSTGQIPSFEAVKIAEYLAQTAIDNKAYIVGLTDYDPAGESIFNALVNKVRESLAVISPLIRLHQISIKYGDNYNHIINLYDTFTLSTNIKNRLNQVWIKDNRPLGVEMNVMGDKRLRIENAVLSQVDPMIVENISLERARLELTNELLIGNEEYQLALKLITAIELNTAKDVADRGYEFSNKWIGTLSRDNVTKMTVIQGTA